MNLSDQIEYFAERHLRGELTDEDIAELTILCQAPDFARDFVQALGDYEEWRRATRPSENREKFVQAILKRTGRRVTPADFPAAVARAARQRERENPARRVAPRRGNAFAWAISLAACVGVAVLIFLITRPGSHPNTAANTDQPSKQEVDLAKIEEQRQRAQRELAEVEANRIRAQQQLEEIERRRAALMQTTPPNTAASERQNALDQIEAERRKVDAELAAMREARRQAEANVRITEEAKANVKTEQRTPDKDVVQATKTPPQTNPTPPVTPKVDAETIARIDAVNGDVMVVKGDKRRKAEQGSNLLQGEGIETFIGATAKITFLDHTTLNIGSTTLIAEFFSTTAEGTTYAKTIAFKKGSLVADVTPQPSTHPMTVRTDQAEIIVVGTKFTASAKKESTWLDMQSGKVNFRNRKTGNAVPVSGGETAVMEPDKDAVVTKKPRFMKGINFGGKAVIVEGESWLSQQDAQAKGLSFVSEPRIATSNATPAWSPEPDMVEMLTSGIYAKGATLGIKQTVPQGKYDIYAWVMEPQADYSRSFEIQIEGQSVQQNIASQLKRGEWQKLGPYTVTVTDGSIDINLIKTTGEPCLMGVAIFKHEE